jgi:hypothetical protein
VALTDSVDVAHVPIPTNDSERLLFRQAFETLVGLDCEGTVRPGLAVTWTADPGRRIWIFTLQESSDSSVPRSEAADLVVSNWRERPAATKSLGIQAVSAHTDGSLRVTMRDPLDSIPSVFADPTLAVSHESDPRAWPIDGAGIVRTARHPSFIEYRIEPGEDPRDALDRGPDLLVTRDPALVEYAAGKPGVRTFPLPWSRTYVLLEAGDRQGELAGALNATAVRSSLARDAVWAGARAAEPPYWWSDRTACGADSTLRPGNASSRVVYRKDDEVARGLAERIVALASTATGLRAVGLDAAAFATAVRGNAERAYVIDLPRQSLAPCRDASMWPEGARLLPLIDTRAYAIVRKGAPPLTVDWDGTIRVAGP